MNLSKSQYDPNPHVLLPRLIMQPRRHGKHQEEQRPSPDRVNYGYLWPSSRHL